MRIRQKIIPAKEGENSKHFLNSCRLCREVQICVRYMATFSKFSSTFVIRKNYGSYHLVVQPFYVRPLKYHTLILIFSAYYCFIKCNNKWLLCYLKCIINGDIPRNTYGQFTNNWKLCYILWKTKINRK